MLLPGGPGTGIAWKHGRLHEVVIDGGGRAALTSASA
jgi:hypothetical protein